MRSAIIGCGSIAKIHAGAICNLPGNKLVAFADCNLEKAKDLKKSFGDDQSKAYASLEEMIAKEEIDVLHICTPHYLHVPMAVYTLSRHINVFMEKPPAISWQEFKELQSIKTTAKLGVCFQNRYNKSVEAIKEVLLSGKAGQILGARAFVTWQRDEKYYTESDWRGSQAAEGGGALINQAIHTLDLLTYFIGTPTSVEATTINHHLRGIIEVEDTVEAYIQFENIAASFYATTAFCMNAPVLIELVCENRIIRMEDTEVTYIFQDHTKETLSFKMEQGLGKDYWGQGHLLCIKDFYYCLETGNPFKIDVQEVAQVMQLMLGIYESSKNKSVVYF